MKRNLITIVLAVLLSMLVIAALAQNDTWSSKEDFGGGIRTLGASFVIGSKIYAGTGYDETPTVYDDIWEYDIANDSWSQKDEFDGGARFGSVGFTINGKGYIALGANLTGATFNDVWEYNSSNDTWTKKADFPGDGRVGAFVFVVDNKAYIGTGQPGEEPVSDLWVFDPVANAWTEKASLPAAARSYVAAFAIGTKGYVGTGADVNEDGLADFWEYNTVNNQWTRKADYPAATFGAVGFATATRGYIGLGSTNKLYSYYPTQNVWAEQADFEDAFVYVNGSVAVNSGKAYVGLGLGSNTPGYFMYAMGNDQTITFNALPNKTVVDVSFDLAATSSSALAVSYTSSNTAVATISGVTVTIVGGGTTSIKATQAGNTTYDAALPVEQTLTVTKANQTITFGVLPGKNANDASFALTATASSTLPVSYVSSNTSVATISGSTVTIVGGGTTTITASQAGDATYNAATSVDRDLVVTKVSQTITFGALAAKNVGDAAFGLTATASSGLPVSYSSSNTLVATVSGSTVTIAGGGTTTITATQPGNSIYSAATSVGRDLVVSKGTQTWVGSLPTTGGFGDDITLTLHLSSNLDYTLTSSNESVATVSFDGTNFIISPKALGTTTITASQPGDSNFEAAPTITADLVISKGTQTITFDDIPPTNYADGRIVIIATASSGLPVTFDPTDINDGIQMHGNIGVIFKSFNGDITARVAGTDNYLPTAVTKHITIGKAAAELSMQPIPEKSTSDPPFAPSVVKSYAGMSYSLSSSNTSVATIVNQQVVIKGVGTSTIQATMLPDDRIAGATSSQVLTVKEPHTITFDELPVKTFSDAAFTVQATSSAGLPITFSSSDPAVATVNGNTVTIAGAGYTSIIASAGSSTLKNATASQVLVVKGADQAPDQQGQFWGVSQTGGLSLLGTVFKTNADGTGMRVIKEFVKKDDIGISPYSSTVKAPNGKLYSSTSRGGKNGYGTLFEFDPATGTMTNVFDYDYSDFPIRTPAISADGKLYGTRSADFGDELRPVVFELDLATKTITHVKSTSGTLAYISDVMIAHDGKIYLTGIVGPSNDKRAFYEYIPASGTITKLAEMPVPAGAYNQAGVVETSNGKIYGTNTLGGANSQGNIFEFDPVARTLVAKADFPAAAAGVSTSPRGLMITSTGRIFGVTSYSGAGKTGYIYEYDPVQNTITTRGDFPDFAGVPTGQMAEGSNGKLYGSDNSGNSGGGLYEFNPITFELREVFIFTDATGLSTNGNLAVVGNKLYGLTQRGGAHNGGVLFEMDYTTRQYSKKFEFGDDNDGMAPVQGMVLHSNGKLYGVTHDGGTNGDGTIFEVDPATDEYKSIFNFDRNTVGGNPSGAVLLGQNGKLYGSTRGASKGPYVAGSFFEFDVESKTYSPIVAMNSADGNAVFHQLGQAKNGKLYALTSYGAINGKGSLVEVDAVARTYKKLADLTDIRGYYPYSAPFVASNGKIYGTTTEGGEFSKGTLFEYDLANNTYTVRHDFDTPTGSSPSVSFIEIDGKLWGVTYNGGKVAGGGVGVLFNYDLATGEYTVKADLENIGSAPGGRILQAANGKLYFATTNGGRTANGVVVEYDIAAEKLTVKSEFGYDLNIDRMTSFLVQTSKLVKRDQTITIAPIESKVLGSGSFTPTVTASSGLPAALSAGNDKITWDASINKIVLQKAGKAILKASQAGDASYFAAADVQTTFCINPPKPEIQYAITAGGISTLTSSWINGTNQWYRDGVAIDNATSTIYTVNTAGMYTVKAVSDDCTSELSDAFPIIVTGDVEPGLDRFSVYPNPAVERIYIVLPGGNQKKVTLIQTDGRIAEERETSSNVLEVDVRNYASGLYLVRISDENGTHPALKFIRK